MKLFGEDNTPGVHDFMLQPQLRSKVNVSFWFLLLKRCQQNMLVLNKCVSVTGIFDEPGCASALRNHPSVIIRKAGPSFKTG